MKETLQNKINALNLEIKEMASFIEDLNTQIEAAKIRITQKIGAVKELTQMIKDMESTSSPSEE